MYRHGEKPVAKEISLWSSTSLLPSLCLILLICEAEGLDHMPLQPLLPGTCSSERSCFLKQSITMLASLGGLSSLQPSQIHLNNSLNNWSWLLFENFKWSASAQQGFYLLEVCWGPSTIPIFVSQLEVGKKDLGSNPSLLLIHQVTLNKNCNFSESQFLHLKSQYNNSVHLVRPFWEVYELSQAPLMPRSAVCGSMSFPARL